MFKKSLLILILFCINFSTYCAESKEAKELESPERSTHQLEKKEKKDRTVTLKNNVPYKKLEIIFPDKSSHLVNFGDKKTIEVSTKINLQMRRGKFMSYLPPISEKGEFALEYFLADPSDFNSAQIPFIVNILGKTLIVRENPDKHRRGNRGYLFSLE